VRHTLAIDAARQTNVALAWTDPLHRAVKQAGRRTAR
jgi:hypothetical protein